nr:hypothetical protein [Mesorhizobium sp.]
MLKGILTTALLLGSAGFALANNSWIGTWKSDWNGAIDTTLVVSSVDHDSAQVKYSWARTSFGSAGSVNMTAKVSGKKLSWSGHGVRFVFTHKGATLSGVRTTSLRTDWGTFRKAQ